jgi:hypothetical protein
MSNFAFVSLIGPIAATWLILVRAMWRDILLGSDEFAAILRLKSEAVAPKSISQIMRIKLWLPLRLDAR